MTLEASTDDLLHGLGLGEYGGRAGDLTTSIAYSFQFHHENVSNITLDVKRPADYNVMTILESIIAIIGIFSNFVVVSAFLHDRMLRIRIPNIFIINQVSSYYFYS